MTNKSILNRGSTWVETRVWLGNVYNVLAFWKVASSYKIS